MYSFYDMLPYAQMGGGANAQQQQLMQIVQAYAQIAGVDPRQVMQQLQQMQPQQQQQALQQMMQAVEQGSGQTAEEETMQPQMKMGGAPCYECGGMYDDGGYVPSLPVGPYDLPVYNNGSTASGYGQNMAMFGYGGGYMDPAWKAKEGTSIVDYLNEHMEDSSYNARKQYAREFKMKNYRGTAEQNVQLLNLIKNAIEAPDSDMVTPDDPRYPRPPKEVSKPAPEVKPLVKTMSAPKPVAPKSNKDVAKDFRNLESGTIVDKGTNTMYVIKKGKVVKSAPVLTGQAGRNKNTDLNRNPYSLSYLENNPQARSTPTGTYFMQPNPNIYGWAGFNLNPIKAYGQPAPVATNEAIHITYGAKPKGNLKGHPDPAEFARRNALYNMQPNQRYASYGCTNAQGQTIDCLTGEFPKGDTAVYIDSRNPGDLRYINSVKGKKQYGGSTFSGDALYQSGGEPRTFLSTASQFLPGYETYLDLKDIFSGAIKGNKAQMNQGVIGLGQPFSGKAISGTLDYITEKLSDKQSADELADKRETIINMTDRERMELFKRYGSGGYDKWVKAGKPKLADGGIHIKPENRGKFTASANRAGMGVQEFARHVLANKEDYSSTQVKRANFARNASKWHHQDGGLTAGQEMDATPELLAWLDANGYTYEHI